MTRGSGPGVAAIADVHGNATALEVVVDVDGLSGTPSHAEVLEHAERVVFAG